MLKTFGEIIYQQAVEAFKDVAFATFFLSELALVDALAIIQNQLKVTGEDSPEGRGVLVLLYFLSHRDQEKRDPFPFPSLHPEPVGVEIGEKRVFWYI